MATKISGSFSGTGQSSSAVVYGPFNLSLRGTFDATVQLERSFDGTNWEPVAKNADGEAAAYAAPVSLQGEEWEVGVLYRFNCTARNSGTVNYRLGA